MKTLILSVLASSALLLTACGHDCDDPDDGNNTATTSTATIVSPADGAVLSAADPFTVSFERFTVVPAGTAVVEGHMHVFLNGDYTIIEADTFSLSELSIDALPPGNYDITVQLVRSDHSTIEGGSDTVTVTLAN